MTSSIQSQFIRHRIFEVLVARPDRDLTTTVIHRVLNDPDISRNQVQGHLSRMSKKKDLPVRHTSYGRYRYMSRSNSAVALREYAAAVASEALAVPEVVETTEALPVFAETTVAVVPEHAPVLGGEWERIRRVPASVTSLMPLKPNESLVVTEDERYFILTELEQA